VSKSSKRKKRHAVKRQRIALGKRLAKIAYSEVRKFPDETTVKLRTAERAAQLLSNVATALNECEKAGILPILAHNAVITEWGYVLYLPGPHEYTVGELWKVRTRDLMPPPEPANDERVKNLMTLRS
jgi:hypothetical protein